MPSLSFPAPRKENNIFKICFSSVKFSSVAQLCLTLCDPMNHSMLASCPSPSPGVHSDSSPSSWWCHPAILSSVVPFSSCPQYFPASESFRMSQLFAWGGQSTGVSALPSFLPKKSQVDLLQNGLVGSPCSPRDCQESSPTPQFKGINFSGVQLSSQSNSHIHTWPLEKP